MDAILDFCTQNDVDPATVGKLVSKSLKEKIQVEAMNANMLKIEKGGKLPV